MDGRVIAGRVLTGVTVGIGVALAVSMVPPSGLVAVSVLAVPAAVATATAARVRAAAGTLGIPSFPGAAAVVAAMTLAIIGCTASLGLSGLMAGVAALVGGLLLCRPRGAHGDGEDATSAVTSPPHGDSPVPAHSQQPAHHDPLGRLRDPRDLTDTELCEAWRISYLFVSRVGDPMSVDRIAAQRQRYLDEIQRRDPQGFARWMASGARAASNPAPFLGHHEH